MTPYSKIDQPETITLLFPPESSEYPPCPTNGEDVCLEINPGDALHCRYYLASPEAPIIYFFPAPGDKASGLDQAAKSYQQQGMNVFLASYRGYGKNRGCPSVAAMYADSHKLFHLALEWLKAKGSSGSLFVMGRSLGSVCAIDTVYTSSDAIKGLIIESGICGTVPFLKAIGGKKDQKEILEEEGFNNIRKIEKIKIPTLIFHGSRDTLVPVAEAEELQASSGARSKQFFVIPGADHHTVSKTGGDLFVATIKQFIDTVCGVNTWRQKRKKYKNNQEGQKS